MKAQRLRLTFARGGEARELSHLEVTRDHRADGLAVTEHLTNLGKQLRAPLFSTVVQPA